MMVGVSGLLPRIKGTAMRRWFVVAICLLGSAAPTPTFAGDFDVPTLRGTTAFIPAPPTYTRWEGFYFGGQVGQSSAGMNFAGATQSLIAYLLRTTALERQQAPSEWGVLGHSDTSGTSYGGFVGYNMQWSDAILGVDLHYNRSSFFSNAPVAPIARVVSAGGNTYYVNITGDASMRITDYGAARVRGGWAIGSLLPYATFGFAVGRADVTRSAQVSGAENPPTGYPTVACDPLTGCVAFSYSASDGKNAAWIYGWSAGGGLDFQLMPNFFVRAEYEYLSFAKIQGIEARLHTARVGAGIKF
jgi:opacity protein-like surface antigen